MESAESIRHLLRDLLSGQKLAVLSTHNAGQPYASLVAYAFSEDLKYLYFVTPRSTRKFSNLSADCRMAFLITSSANQESDFHQASAVTIIGSAAEITGEEKQQALSHYLVRHPYLEDFARAPSCAMVKVYASSYILVKNFQQVMELHVAS